MEKLIITSADGHAVMPPEAWAQYLDKKYHRYLQRLHNDKATFSDSMKLLNDAMLTSDFDVYDLEHAYRSGQWEGLWNHDIRIQEMDREGVAAEFVFPGDLRAIDLFFNTTNASYSSEAIDAGALAYDRWALDTFGASKKDRLLLVGAPMTGLDLDAMIKEAHWMADNGFTGVYSPNYCAVAGQVPIYDKYWDPLWKVYAERNIVLITHAGWGLEQGFMHGEVEAAQAEVKLEGGDHFLLMKKLGEGVFNDSGVFGDLRSRKIIWQLMFGGVFDRFPNLKMMETEVRADWIPDTIALLDTAWEKNRNSLPGKRKPSEYWQTNCMAGLSFMNKAEVQMRDRIGVKTMAFGRDYPHTEATWPNSLNYWSDIFRSVSESDIRDILGENMIRFLGLDRAKLAKIAERIAPTYQQIKDGPDLNPELLRHLNNRCGYSKPAEGAARIPDLEKMLIADIPRIHAASLAFAA
jgi:predicted TIM-barrel fold metal-dependent hydrolase